MFDREAQFPLVFGVLTLASTATPVAADTIYLKNGRTINTASATVVDDRVMFVQFGHPTLLLFLPPNLLQCLPYFEILFGLSLLVGFFQDCRYAAPEELEIGLRG